MNYPKKYSYIRVRPYLSSGNCQIRLVQNTSTTINKLLNLSTASHKQNKRRIIIVPLEKTTIVRRITPIFIILILFIFNSCKKEGALQPLLPGNWKSTTTDLQLFFQDGNFTIRYQHPTFNSYYAYTGTYTLKGNNIYLSANQVEWLDTDMPVPKTTKFENPLAEPYKFWIRDEKLEFDYTRRDVNYVLIHTKSIYVKMK